MLAYAASRPAIAARRSSPHSMLIIASAHVVAIAVLISLRMELPIRPSEPPIIVDSIRAKPVPPAPVPTPPAGNPLAPHQTTLDPQVELPPLDRPAEPGPDSIVIQPRLGPTVTPLPPLPTPTVASTGPSLLTPASELKPPYPRQKLLLEEEASLTLKLSIDDRGRVTAVEPVGRADRLFLEAARRHLIAHWRYKPANEGGHAVASSLVTTLHFRLDG